MAFPGKEYLEGILPFLTSKDFWTKSVPAVLLVITALSLSPLGYSKIQSMIDSSIETSVGKRLDRQEAKLDYMYQLLLYQKGISSPVDSAKAK